jgi:hypothetical protein
MVKNEINNLTKFKKWKPKEFDWIWMLSYINSWKEIVHEKNLLIEC